MREKGVRKLSTRKKGKKGLSIRGRGEGRKKMLGKDERKLPPPACWGRPGKKGEKKKKISAWGGPKEEKGGDKTPTLKKPAAGRRRSIMSQ